MSTNVLLWFGSGVGSCLKCDLPVKTQSLTLVHVYLPTNSACQTQFMEMQWTPAWVKFNDCPSVGNHAAIIARGDWLVPINEPAHIDPATRLAMGRIFAASSWEHRPLMSGIDPPTRAKRSRAGTLTRREMWDIVCLDPAHWTDCINRRDLETWAWSYLVACAHISVPRVDLFMQLVFSVERGDQSRSRNRVSLIDAKQSFTQNEDRRRILAALLVEGVVLSSHDTRWIQMTSLCDMLKSTSIKYSIGEEDVLLAAQNRTLPVDLIMELPALKTPCCHLLVVHIQPPRTRVVSTRAHSELQQRVLDGIVQCCQATPSCAVTIDNSMAVYPLQNVAHVVYGFAPTAAQMTVAFNVMTQQVACVPGPAGSGKTTIVRLLRLMVDRLVRNVTLHSTAWPVLVLLAVSATAAERLASVVNDTKVNSLCPADATKKARTLFPVQAYTVDYFVTRCRHHVGEKSQKPCRLLDPSVPKFIVVDEAGMLANDLMAQFFEAVNTCAPGSKVWLVGDPEQLPPVTPSGCVFSEIVRAQLRRSIPQFAIAELNIVHRNKQDHFSFLRTRTQLHLLAAKMQQYAVCVDDCTRGHAPATVRWFNRCSTSHERCVATIKEFCIKDGKFIDDTCIISFMRFTPLGTCALNAIIQREVHSTTSPYFVCAAHPDAGGVSARLYTGDPVIYTDRQGEMDQASKEAAEKTKDALVVRNGARGQVVSASVDTVVIQFLPQACTRMSSGTVSIKRGDRKSMFFCPAYAFTVHRFQGNEADRVLLCVDDQQRRMVLRRNVYTAFTRHGKELGIVASPEIITAMSDSCETASNLPTLSSWVNSLWSGRKHTNTAVVASDFLVKAFTQNAPTTSSTKPQAECMSQLR